jgi:3-oxoacyl-[acyl-carrier protein] reductase
MPNTGHFGVFMILKGAVAVLTGAGRLNGVGAFTAKLLAEEGCNILINCIRKKDQALEVIDNCRALGVEAELIMGDVTKKEDCLTISNFVQKKWARTDILINCVGATRSVPYEKMDLLNEGDFYSAFDANVLAPFLMAQSLQSQLRKSGNGVIVNVSSAAGITGKGSSIAYAAAKGAENTLTLALAQALSPEVRVNAVCPSFIDSSWWEDVYSGRGEQYNQLITNIKNSNLLRRVLTPQDVANTILSIIKNPVMTGELIRLDSGAHIGIANPRD